MAEESGSFDERLRKILNNNLPLERPPVPENFWEAWSKQNAAHWLILLDALDEVSDSQRDDLLKWLKDHLPNLRQHRIIITSRSTGYRDDFNSPDFIRYDLLPFTPQQTKDFADKWFNTDASSFLNKLNHIQAGDISGTPLLLTVASKVFSSKGSELPKRRVDLYEKIVEVWLEEANQENRLNGELGEPLAAPVGQHIERLAYLALRTTEVPDAPNLEQLQGFIAEYLHQAEEFSEGRARNFGRNYLEIMARRSGVFTQRDGEYQFIHPTFREYLAAKEIIAQCHCQTDRKMCLKCIWQKVLFRWHEPTWQQVALFALNILSEKGHNVSPIVERILHTGGKDGLLFAGQVLAEQGGISTQLTKRIIDGLLVIDDWKLVDILGRLHDEPRIVNRLMALAQTGKRGYFRAGADIEH